MAGTMNVTDRQTDRQNSYCKIYNQAITDSNQFCWKSSSSSNKKNDEYTKILNLRLYAEGLLAYVDDICREDLSTALLSVTSLLNANWT